MCSGRLCGTFSTDPEGRTRLPVYTQHACTVFGPRVAIGGLSPWLRHASPSSTINHMTSSGPAPVQHFLATWYHTEVSARCLTSQDLRIPSLRGDHDSPASLGYL